VSRTEVLSDSMSRPNRALCLDAHAFAGQRRAQLSARGLRGRLRFSRFSIAWVSMRKFAQMRRRGDSGVRSSSHKASVRLRRRDPHECDAGQRHEHRECDEEQRQGVDDDDPWRALVTISAMNRDDAARKVVVTAVLEARVAQHA
jgi:hypothetical protein